MWFHQRRPGISSRTVRVARRVTPVIEGVEPRLLLTGVANISGTTYKDLTGNGSSSDEKALAGVTVQLFKSGGTTPVASTVSSSDGDYAFDKIAVGSYFVQELVPTGSVQTGGVNGYTITAQSGKSYTANNFDNFTLFPTPSITDLRYTVTAPNGTVTHVKTLQGNVQQGDSVNANFVLAKPEMIEFVSYVAPNGSFDPADIRGEVDFDQAESVTLASGNQSVTVKVPNAYFALDLVAGPVIDHLLSNADVSYSAQSRLLDSVQGGTETNGVSSISGSVATAPAAGKQTGIGEAGATVTLTGTDYEGKEVKLTVTTNANGDYTFSNLQASNIYGYTISELPPSGFVQAGNPSTKFLQVYLETNTTSVNKNFIVAPRVVG
jgi:uncharacterized surface anchored protein